MITGRCDVIIEFTLGFWDSNATRRRVQLLLLFIPTRHIWRTDFQIPSSILINSVLNVAHLAVFILNSNNERLIIRPAFNTAWQKSFQVRTAIGCVVLLIAFVITEYVNAIEVWLTQRVWLTRTTLFQNHPTSRLGLLSRILVLRTFRFNGVAVKPLPSHKLTTRTIENNIARHCQFNLLSIYPTCWGR